MFAPSHRKIRNRQADDAAAIAKKLANPIGALISLPFQNNMDLVSAITMVPEIH